MLDLIFLLVIISFFPAAIRYSAFCSRLNKGEVK